MRRCRLRLLYMDAIYVRYNICLSCCFFILFFIFLDLLLCLAHISPLFRFQFRFHFLRALRGAWPLASGVVVQLCGSSSRKSPKPPGPKPPIFIGAEVPRCPGAQVPIHRPIPRPAASPHHRRFMSWGSYYAIRFLLAVFHSPEDGTVGIAITDHN